MQNANKTIPFWKAIKQDLVVWIPDKDIRNDGKFLKLIQQLPGNFDERKHLAEQTKIFYQNNFHIDRTVNVLTKAFRSEY